MVTKLDADVVRAELNLSAVRTENDKLKSTILDLKGDLAYFVPAVDDLAEELKLEKAATDHLKSRLEMCLNSKKDTGSGNETGQLKSPPEKLLT